MFVMYVGVFESDVSNKRVPQTPSRLTRENKTTIRRNDLSNYS